MLILFSFLSAYKDRNKKRITDNCRMLQSRHLEKRQCHRIGTTVPVRWHGRANAMAQLCQPIVTACAMPYTESGPIGYFFVIRNQSTSVHPPSLVTIAGRVQNMPTLVPIHCPSLAWKGLPNGENFFPSRL